MNEQIPLQVASLTKSFESSSWWGGSKESFTAVDAISFDLKAGEILGFLGPNGAGKTTTIHMLLGVTALTRGSITYFGKDFQKHRSEIMRKVSFASTYNRLVGRLTLYENLVFHAELYGIVGDEQKTRINRFIEQFDLGHVQHRKAAALSAGENTRAHLAKAFLSYPKVVLLDEPTAALDPDIAQIVRNFVLEQRKEFGVSIIFTSHNMLEVSEICDRVLVLKDGTIIDQDTPERLAARIKTAYLHLRGNHNDAIAEYARSCGLLVSTKESWLVIEIEEHKVAEFLPELTRQNLLYTHITLEKPRLEDYFITIAQRKGMV